METLHLKRGRDVRIRSGHLWAFAGEIAEDLKGLPPGSAVALCSARGELLGRGYVNPHSLIAVRLMTRGDEPWDNRLIHRRIAAAVRCRRSYLSQRQALRLVYAESDGLPGLIVDQFGPHLVVQSLTAGMERKLDEVAAALKEIVEPESILLKGNSPFRELEGLPAEDRVLAGTPPEAVAFMEGGVRFTAHLREGQKSGFYLDQTANRALLAPWAKDRRVLDLFCYTGAWGLTMLAAGAREAVMVDTSAKALSWGMEDAAANALGSRATFVEADAGDFLADAASRKDNWDMVVLDPPSLIRSRAQLTVGTAAYRALNRAALAVVAPGGLLVSCSCSYHLTRERHLEVLGQAAFKAGRRVRAIAVGGHPTDHPVLPGHPETEYLKCVVLVVE